ncbi:uncharacterized protein IL334_000469 [Kwoniella shivajii]|uniref:DNA mismatch repair protein n=1 Tax=Kwoniella shivajii TaxID=564305 RepID=A0ABZ1CPA1_9TREE|nr:hypothetical protein IL334_000469 [Kwoniella shivajii]
MAKAKAEPSQDSKGPRQATLASFFGAPKPGPRPPSTNPLSSPASTNLRTPSSLAGSSPVVRTTQGKDIGRASNPIKKNFVESEEELTPPPESGPSSSARAESSGKKTLIQDEDDVEMEDTIDADGSPIKVGRRQKRKVMYVESESDDSEADVAPKGRTGRKPRKSLKEDSDSDDFVFDEKDDAAMAAAADEYDASIISRSPSAAFSASPEPTKKKPAPARKGFVVSKAVPKKATTSWSGNSAKPSEASSSRQASTSRPGPTPLSNATSNDNERNGSANAVARSNDANSQFLTRSELSKLEAKEEKQATDRRFDFLRPENLKDMDGNRPDHPDYDKRTLFIKESRLEALSPFERQFWRIKRHHYDTVLFFQKGKFYELYEDDAKIGHQEFDLKLTERVNMSMVGVPEQVLQFWIQKFLGAGYKVGIVEQAETAIGMEMRQKKDESKTNGERNGSGGKATKPDKLVNRELRQVFTNGTIVDGTYLSSDDANHCIAIKEFPNELTGNSAYGVCIMDASTGAFELSAFEDDVCRTRLETMFRQLRPKELVHAKGNLSMSTSRMLRNILPSSTLWQSFKEGKEFCSASDTLDQLSEFFEMDEDDQDSDKPPLPEAIQQYRNNACAMEALGGLLFYLRSLRLDKDLVSQSNFNVYDPIREGKCLILDGQTLAHMEVLVNGEGGLEGTLLDLLQRCITPFGKRLFHIWLSTPLRDAKAINDRLDAVDDILKERGGARMDFSGRFSQICKGLPDLERLISRIHARSERESKFLEVIDNFKRLQAGFDEMRSLAEGFDSPSIGGLLRTAPDLTPYLAHMNSLYTVEKGEKTVQIMPQPGADEESDSAAATVNQIVSRLDEYFIEVIGSLNLRKELRDKCVYWHSAQGLKELYHIEVPAATKVPRNWIKTSGTKSVTRYHTPEILPMIREYQEAVEIQNATKREFYKRLMAEFDKDRAIWLQAVRVIAELDCLVSLAKSTQNMDDPKCRPEFIDSSSAFIDFEDLRHPSMCLRSDFISNNVQLGDTQARQVLLTGPNMAGKSTLLRMTAAGVIMAQLGCYVPASKARLSPVDRIQTRMGAYDNMFASASTFKVELDECAKILREAGPRSLVILDELGRGTSTYDGMAIAGAVLHHLATHTLPLGFFATHYGSLTDDFTYHPNIRKMHMQTHVDDQLQQVVFLYKLIPGVAESSHGTHVAQMAGVPMEVVNRAQSVSDQFFAQFNAKLNTKRQSSLPLMAQADFAWLMRLLNGLNRDEGKAALGQQMEIIKECAGRYEIS